MPTSHTSKSRPALEVLGLLDRDEEGGLDEVLRVRFVARKVACDPEEPLRAGVEHARQGGEVVALAEALEESTELVRVHRSGSTRTTIR